MLIVALATGLVAAPGLVAPYQAGSAYDGGITASAGTFILHGQLPYRDFWLLYGPLTGYVAAALSALFGNEILVLRIAGLLVAMTAGALGYRVMAFVAPGIRRGTAAVLAASIPTYFLGLDLSPWFLAVALALLAICVAAERRPRHLWATGVVVGFVALARLDVGAYALIAVIIQTRSLRPAASAAAVVVPVACAFLLLVPLAALVEQVIWYPLIGTQVFRGVPGPSLFGLFSGDNPLTWLVYYLPVLLIIGAVGRRLRTGSIPSAIAGLLVLAILCRLQTVGRADVEHAAQAFAPGFLLAAYVVGPATTTARRLAIAFAGAIPVSVAALPLLWLSLPPDRYDQALTEAASIVRTRTAPNEPIFVGELRNARVFANPMIIYFLADRPAGVRDSMYNPGVTTTAATQLRMVDDLATRHVRYLVLDVRYAGCYETTNASRFVGSSILDAAIVRDYRVLADFGAVVVMAARDSDEAVVTSSLWVDPGIPQIGPLVCDRSDLQP
jgi:hypothetical protein